MRYQRSIALLLCLSLLLSVAVFATGKTEAEDLDNGGRETVEQPAREPVLPGDGTPIDLPGEAPTPEAPAEQGTEDNCSFRDSGTNFHFAAPLIELIQEFRERQNSFRTENEAVQTSKTVQANDDGTYTLTLEAYATGNVSHETKQIPTDVVLLLDQSGSMAACMTCGYAPIYGHVHQGALVAPANQYAGTVYQMYTDNGLVPVAYNSSDSSWYYLILEDGSYYYGTKANSSDINRNLLFEDDAVWCDGDTALHALQEAAKDFIDIVANQAQEYRVDHTLSVVGFASGFPYESNSNNTELFVGSTQYSIDSLSSARYQAAMNDMRTPEGKNAAYASINALSADGLTYPTAGLYIVNNLLDECYSEERNRVVVVFTDGIPGHSTSTETEMDQIANMAIGYYSDCQEYSTYRLKNTLGATVYTVGIFANANGSLANGLPADNGWGYVSTANRFMHLLSSNYPNATNQSYTGSQAPDLNGESYYLSASDPAGLANAFQSIANQIDTADIDLSQEAYLRDIIAPSFQYMEGTVKTYTVDYTASGRFDDRTKQEVFLTITVDGDTIDVTGFDYAKHFVSKQPKADGSYGKKLVVEITVQARDGFLGGGSVPTNMRDSGVYDGDGNVVENFEIPSVDVSMEFSPKCHDACIYLGQTIDLSSVMEYYAADGLCNGYADVTYSLCWPDGTVIATYTIEAGATQGVFQWVGEDASAYPLEETTRFDLVVTIGTLNDPLDTEYTEVKTYTLNPTVTVIPCALTIHKIISGSNVVDGTFFFLVEDQDGNTLTVPLTTRSGAGSVTLTHLPIGTYTVKELLEWSWRYECSSDSEQGVSFDPTTLPTPITQGVWEQECSFSNTYVLDQWFSAIDSIRNVFGG